MTKYLNVLLGFGLGLCVWFGWEMWPSSAPTEHGKEIVLMMKYDRGWRMGKNQHCIVHEKANLVVEPGRLWARVRRWDDANLTHKDLNWTDCKQINAAFAEACKNVIRAKADEPLTVGENAKKLVESMLAAKGWEVLNNRDNGLIARSADICVYSDGSVWLFSNGKPVRDTKGYTSAEREYISSNFKDAQTAVIAMETADCAKSPQKEDIGKEAEKLVQSMLSGVGWKNITAKDDGIYNIEAKLAVYSDGSVWVWEENGGPGGKKPVRDTNAFSKMEIRHIAANYRAAQKTIIKSSVK